MPSIDPVNGTTFDFTQSFDGSTDLGFNITSPNSELAHLYYVSLGNVGLYDANRVRTGCGLSCLTNSGPFENIRSTFSFYWSSTKPDPRTSYVLGFSPTIGDSTNRGVSNTFFSWAVRDGDVTVVPLPATFVLFGSALIGLLGLKEGIHSKIK